MCYCLIVFRWRTYFFRPPLPLSPVLPIFGVASAAEDLEVPALAGAAEVAATAVSATATAAAAAAASFSAHENTDKYSKKNMLCHCSVIQMGTSIPCRSSSSFLIY
jgi:hypothetical protein